ncbi:RCC1 repeat-containing protein [Myxococcus stipitatus]|uniref:RCC1 domain-containing protein n=1 Tax=Myxococcus stipitatus TaxID=83455 RepID=UPI001F2BA0E7|nr:RCC1 repeat-containing protein [Myxococcus stipitatus]MCE9667740.1 RCC1 repeat-containing protein [Myxococcus stipitatus]
MIPVVSLLVTVLGVGCSDPEPKPTPVSPTIVESTQSALNAMAYDKLKFHVAVKDDSGQPLDFTWEANDGVFEPAKNGETTSDVEWLGPDCRRAGSPVQVTVSVSNGVAPVTQKVFQVAAVPCPGPLAVSAGARHSVAARPDGTVWTWGDDDINGLLLGAPTSPRTDGFVEVLGLTDVKAVAAAPLHTLVLHFDGTVSAWGYNGYGQLGDKTTESHREPVKVSGLTEVVAIAAGGSHSLALRRDGTVWAWGDNAEGQLGDGTTEHRMAPVQVKDLARVRGIAAGGAHSLAVLADGSVRAWGSALFGELGNGTSGSESRSPVPVAVSNLTEVVAVAAGQHVSLAVGLDGRVWGWGSDGDGILNASTSADTRVPIRVRGVEGVAAVGLGNDFALALTRDGDVWAWGHNGEGQLADGTTTRGAPKKVVGLEKVEVLGVGRAHALVVLDDGRMRAWGSNQRGQLGLPADARRATPVAVADLTGAIAVAASASHSLAVRNDGTVWAWGDNSDGQLGMGEDVGGSSTPVRVASLGDVRAVAAGQRHSLALRDDGTVMSWGRNVNGQLGGSEYTRFEPMRVEGLIGVTAVAAGESHSLALRSNGTVWSWGHNLYGQLGDGTTEDRWTPVQVAGLSGVTAVATGISHSLAVRNDGTVWAWGTNAFGELGDGTTAARTLAVQVLGLSGAVAVAAGRYHSLAVLGDGRVMSWGLNADGQLGDGSNPRGRQLPALVPSLTGVMAVAAGDAHSLAAREGASPSAWGDNASGALGIGEKADDQVLPVPVSGLSEVRAIAAGTRHSLAVAADGSVWAWGENALGQLGNGLADHRTRPILVPLPAMD